MGNSDYPTPTRASSVPGSVSKDPFQQLEMLQLAIRGRIHAHRQAILQLQTEIDTAQSQNRMTQAQELIAELFTQIHHLRTGATESEAIVREITRDIKTLDLAKKNIVASITGIKRFQMLVVAFDQLQRQAKGKRYKETAHALSVGLWALWRCGWLGGRTRDDPTCASQLGEVAVADTCTTTTYSPIPASSPSTFCITYPGRQGARQPLPILLLHRAHRQPPQRDPRSARYDAKSGYEGL